MLLFVCNSYNTKLYTVFSIQYTVASIEYAVSIQYMYCLQYTLCTAIKLQEQLFYTLYDIYTFACILCTESRHNFCMFAGKSYNIWVRREGSSKEYWKIFEEMVTCRHSIIYVSPGKPVLWRVWTKRPDARRWPLLNSINFFSSHWVLFSWGRCVAMTYRTVVWVKAASNCTCTRAHSAIVLKRIVK